MLATKLLYNLDTAHPGVNCAPCVPDGGCISWLTSFDSLSVCECGDMFPVMTMISLELLSVPGSSRVGIDDGNA